MKEIIKFSDPLIKEFINLKETSDSNIVISSKKALDKALIKNIQILKLFISENFIKDYSTHQNLYYCKKKLMQEIIGYKLHQGIFALAYKPNYTSIENLDSKILILNGLTSPENVGSIIRSACAFEYRSIIFDSKNCSPYLQRCIRVSMGNIFFCKIYKSIDLISDLEYLKEKNYKIYSTANLEQAKSINNFKVSKKHALIIGSEGHGIDKNILNLSCEILKINISNDVGHLNASIAASISMHCLSQN